MYQVNCEHPRIIINPLLGELLTRYRYYYINGKWHIWRGRNSDYHYSKVSFSKEMTGVTLENVDNFYVIDHKTGETFPIYNVVPCGHCSVCECSKQNSFVQRCTLETQMYLSKPYFVTLTYDNDHLPKVNIKGKDYPTLCVRDVQLFLKRFRQNLKRSGVQDCKYMPLRYAVTGEYGKNTKRPHYHIILWNVQSFDDKSYSKVLDLLNKSWKNGFIQCRLINPEKDNGDSFKYTTKYLHKDVKIHVPYNVWYDSTYKRSFHSTSKRNGGIGAPYIKAHSEEIKRAGVNAMFFNLYTGAVSDLYFSSYVLNLLYPSYSRLVPSNYRKAIKELAYYDWQHDHDLLLSKLREESPCYISKNPPINIKDPMYQNSDQCIEVIEKWRNSPKYVSPDKAREMQVEREFFMTNLFAGMKEKDIKDIVYKSKRILQRQYNLEIL